MRESLSKEGWESPFPPNIQRFSLPLPSTLRPPVLLSAYASSPTPPLSPLLFPPLPPQSDISMLPLKKSSAAVSLWTLSALTEAISVWVVFICSLSRSWKRHPEPSMYWRLKKKKKKKKAASGKLLMSEKREKLSTQIHMQGERSLSGGNLCQRKFRSLHCLHLQLKHIDRAVQIDVRSEMWGGIVWADTAEDFPAMGETNMKFCRIW